MNTDFKIQVKKDHYFNGYDSIGRFISYFYQTSFAIDLNPTSILEIGVGNKTVSNYLKEHDFKVDTLDFDKSLKPDIVSDIREMDIKDKSYDLVMACEVLEHIPWDDVPKAISEIYRVSKKYALISIPYSAFSMESVLAVPFLHGIIKRPFVKILLTIPLFFINRNLMDNIIGSQ